MRPGRGGMGGRDGQTGDAVLAAAEAVRTEQLELLKTLVNIDSGTGDVDGGRKVAAVLIPQLKALGAEVETVPAEAPDLPDNLVATVHGTGKARILMIGHMDTVFGPGTAAARPYTVEGDLAHGPGVADEKGGVVEGLYALKLLHDARLPRFRADHFPHRDERGARFAGHEGANPANCLANSDVELNLEPGDPPDVITVWRKGSATFHIDVKGRGGACRHQSAGRPQRRRGAGPSIAGARTAAALGAGNDGQRDRAFEAGERANIIPDAASAQVNVRVRKAPTSSGSRRSWSGTRSTIAVAGTDRFGFARARFPAAARQCRQPWRSPRARKRSTPASARSWKPAAMAALRNPRSPPKPACPRWTGWGPSAAAFIPIANISI